MTTFQAVITALVASISEFFPLGSSDQLHFLSELTGWASADPLFLSLIALVGALCLAIYLIHDGLSHVSSLLQVVLYWRKPMTLDERMPFFILVASVPAIAVGHLIHSSEWLHPQFTLGVRALLFAGVGIALVGVLDFSKKQKSIADWNLLDAALVGTLSIFAALPGLGLMTCVALVGLVRNYSREATLKFGLYCLFPHLLALGVPAITQLDWRAAQPITGLSWWVIVPACIAAAISSFVSISSVLHSLSKGQWRGVAAWRIFIAAAACITAYLQGRALLS